MTLDEAINRYTSNAEYERTHGSLQGCLEFRQLAEWLKDYKRLKEQEPKTGHWIWQTEDIYQCSECGEDINVKEVMNEPQYAWCPICGCPMEIER